MIAENTFLNDFAIRCFRDQADQEYILARISYRKRFFSQYHWSALQAVEKYIKAILLFNRIPSVDMGHKLCVGLNLLNQLPFINLKKKTREMINHLDMFGCNRYLTYSYAEYKYYLADFDYAIWELRKYCRVLNANYCSMSPEEINEFMNFLSKVTPANVKEGYIAGGTLEKILLDKGHPARKDLIWQNGYFLEKSKKKVTQPAVLSAVNSPLTLYPQYIDTIKKYVKLSKPEIEDFRKEAARRKKESRKAK